MRLPRPAFPRLAAVKPASRRLPVANGKRLISVRRANSIGDVIAATAVADELTRLGFAVEFQAAGFHHRLLRLHPGLHQVRDPSVAVVNLDGAYERHPQKRGLHLHEMYRQRANADLRKFGVQLPPLCNWAPHLECEPDAFSLKTLRKYPPPWIAICPRSNHWPNRTVPDAVWREAAEGMAGTKFWLGNHGPSPKGIVDARCKTIEEVAAWVLHCDLTVSVVSGPMHIAAAFRKPLVAVQQAVDPALHLSPQRDFAVVSPSLDCLNCQDGKCPIAPDAPPCQKVAPEAIAAAVNRTAKSLPGSRRVSAVVAVYKPDLAKLNRCLECVLPQVDEVVVVGDLDSPWPLGIRHGNGKVLTVRMPERKTGYGKKSTFGARHASGEFILQLNDDVYLEPDVVETLLAEMKPDVGIVTHTLRHPDGKIQYAGKFRSAGAMGFGHTDHRREVSRYTVPVEQESACGASMLVRRAAFFAADGFDERYWLFCDDDDLVLKIRQLGFKAIYTPLCEGVHEEHQSLNLTPHWETAMHESNRKFASKWAWYFRQNPDVNRIGKFA